MAGSPPHGLLSRALPWAVAAAMTMIAAAVGWLALRAEPAPPGSSVRLVISLPQNHQLGLADDTSLVRSDHPRFPRAWGADGRMLAIVEWHPQTMRDIWVLDTEGSGEARSLIASPYDEYSPIFSPDSRWLAYVSNESGRYEVHVESSERDRGCWLVSSGGGTEPLWSTDGRELFYRNGDAMITVPVQLTPTFSVGAPRVLFERALKTGIYSTLSYDLTTDGREFLMIERRLELVPIQLHVVLNWGEELRQTVPAGVN